MPAMPDYQPSTYERTHELIAAGDCPVCGRAGSLVTPECTDGHGADCPDRLCAECGIALFVDPVVRRQAWSA